MHSTHLFIRADADIQIGSGHLMRCLALAQAWNKVSGKVTFITACVNENLKNRITEEGFELVGIKNSCPDPSDLKTTLSFINDSRSTKPWIVLDGYHFDTDYQLSIKNNGKPLLVIDDTAHLNHYVADAILNQNINAEKLNYSCGPDTKLLLGTDFVLLRDEFLSYRKWKREIPEFARKVLVTMGGGDTENVTMEVLKSLTQVNVDDIEIKVVIGASNPYLDDLKKVARKSTYRIELIQNATNMPGLMAWADLAISAGGSTSLELAFMGLPSLLILTGDNQKRTVSGLDNYGTAINLGTFSMLAIRQLVKNIENILRNTELRKKMSQRGPEIVDFRGSSRVLEKLNSYFENKYFRLRKVRKEDLKLLWQWANDPEVRKNSFNSEFIPFNKHIEWFNNKINSSDSIIWILEYNDKPIGQIRYDRVSDIMVEIGYSVSKEARGKGISAKLLSMTCDKVFKDLNVTKIKGTIFESNASSIKTFEKAGFIQIEKARISDRACRVFMLSRKKYAKS